MFWRRFIIGSIIGVLGLSGCGRPASLPQHAPPLREGELPRLTVIAGGTQSYWNEARRGAEAAGKKLGAQIIWKVPSGSDLVASQQKLVRDAINNSHGVILAPLDSTELMQPVGEATRAGLAVVVFDRDVFTIQNKLSFVHNDDEKITASMRPDYYEMAYQSVKAIIDYRALNTPPREIKVPPRVVKSLTTDAHR